MLVVFWAFPLERNRRIFHSFRGQEFVLLWMYMLLGILMTFCLFTILGNSVRLQYFQIGRRMLFGNHFVYINFLSFDMFSFKIILRKVNFL